MTNPYAHDPDCAFGLDQYDFECTCRASTSCSGLKPVQDLRAIRDEIAELKRRIEDLEARVAAMDASPFG